MDPPAHEIRARADEIEARAAPAGGSVAAPRGSRASTGCGCRSATAGSRRRSCRCCARSRSLAHGRRLGAPGAASSRPRRRRRSAALPEATAREIFATPETLICGVFAPHGRADAVARRLPRHGTVGLRLGHAERRLGAGRLPAVFADGAPLRSDDGAPRQHMVIVPAAQVEFLDTWHVSGLCGTGSTDFRLDGVLRAGGARRRLAGAASARAAALRLPELHAARDGDRRGGPRRRARGDRRAGGAGRRQAADAQLRRRWPSAATCRPRWRGPRRTCAPRAPSTTRPPTRGWDAARRGRPASRSRSAATSALATTHAVTRGGARHAGACTSAAAARRSTGARRSSATCATRTP